MVPPEVVQQVRCIFLGYYAFWGLLRAVDENVNINDNMVRQSISFILIRKATPKMSERKVG